jgi:hypothetical protein
MSVGNFSKDIARHSVDVETEAIQPVFAGRGIYLILLDLMVRPERFELPTY